MLTFLIKNVAFFKLKRLRPEDEVEVRWRPLPPRCILIRILSNGCFYMGRWDRSK